MVGCTVNRRTAGQLERVALPPTTIKIRGAMILKPIEPVFEAIQYKDAADIFLIWKKIQQEYDPLSIWRVRNGTPDPYKLQYEMRLERSLMHGLSTGYSVYDTVHISNTDEANLPIITLHQYESERRFFKERLVLKRKFTVKQYQFLIFQNKKLIEVVTKQVKENKYREP